MSIDRKQLAQFARARKQQLLAGEAELERESALQSSHKIPSRLRRLFGHRISAEQPTAPVNPTAGPSIVNDVNAFEDYISQLMQARRESGQTLDKF